jgi:phosphatidylglycerophosphate synthase
VSTNTELLRKQLQNKTDPPTYVPARFVSIYITQLLRGLGVRPDMVTLGWILCLFLASILFSYGTRLATAAGGLLMAMYYVLDCVDGELARLTGTSSQIGAQLEQIGHWTTHGTLIVGICYAAASKRPDAAWWVIGALALIGDYTFHFVYYIINLTFDRTRNYGFLHRFTRYLYAAMPLNTNIYFIGAIANSMAVALVVWCVVANVSWLIVFAQYYRIERRKENA